MTVDASESIYVFPVLFPVFFPRAANNGALYFWNSSIILKACKELCPSALQGVQSLHVCLHFEK